MQSHTERGRAEAWCYSTFMAKMLRARQQYPLYLLKSARVVTRWLPQRQLT